VFIQPHTVTAHLALIFLSSRLSFKYVCMASIIIAPINNYAHYTCMFKIDSIVVPFTIIAQSFLSFFCNNAFVLN